MSALVLAVAAGGALLVLAAGYLWSRRRRKRQLVSTAADSPVRMDIPDEEFWRWKPRRADDRQVRPGPRRGVLRRRVHSS